MSSDERRVDSVRKKAGSGAGDRLEKGLKGTTALQERTCQLRYSDPDVTSWTYFLIVNFS